ncbi:hypothetical protein L6164_004513 [Bauhinia variegata]|uniref:Uncharacterized protein n=1 Tax=Bauhinia variegata TaxID=167791 RepID=A0ACB9Q4X3_BAUVA|nr:hypothetical protein L6164_004513 [Bauhinia variegata]
MNEMKGKLALDDESCGRYHTGQLPENIGLVFPKLEYLNAFLGDIPASLGNMSALSILHLSNNTFSGEIPTQLLTECVSLSYLILSYNSISGQIFPRHINLSNLYELMLDNNHFNGTLQGWVGNLSGSNFEGEIPEELCKLDLQFIDLSDNQFSGSIPPCFTMTNLRFLHLQKNRLVGSIPKALLRSPELTTLDLGGNKFSGRIPKFISGLEIIYLKRLNI